ncbi:MAG: 30S ribosomal protein S4 [Anaerolineae bacterium]|jgi:small subunit ribosomal protein S4|nr:30S ribosomal protein S4 [Chloroflexota bacterium]
MARYKESVCKQCRREGMKLFLKGSRCLSPKCAMERRPYAPGDHGRQGQFRRQVSDYGQQLREKQRLRRIYGVLEQQFRRYYELAEKMRGQTGANLLVILERRLDNVVYRLGLAESRAQARQLVTHGHIDLNGRRTDAGSALVSPGDVIAVRERSRGNTYFAEVREVLEHQTVPAWLTLNVQELSAVVNALPSRDAIDLPVNEQLIVEYYSR